MESKTVSLIVFYLLPMPFVWSKKISCTKKTLLRSLKKKSTNRQKSSNNRAKKKDSEEYTVLPSRGLPAARSRSCSLGCVARVQN